MYSNLVNSVDKLKGDSSLKQIYRQSHDNGNSTLMIDFTKTTNISDEYFRVNELKSLGITNQFELYRDIGTFLYTGITHKTGCRVAQPFISNELTRVVVVGDFGDTTLHDYGYNYFIYLKLVFWLSQLHELHINDRVPKIIAARTYECMALKDELDDFITYSKMYGLAPNKDLINSVVSEFPSIPLSVCHRDFQSYNIFVLSDKDEPIICHEDRCNVGIIDIQDMCLGPLTYDLACLLYDYKQQIDDKEKQKLMNMFAHLTKYTYNDIKRWTDTCGKARVMKSIGRHFKLYHMTGNKESFDRAMKANDYLNIF
jgi:hypothetical protein